MIKEVGDIKSKRQLRPDTLIVSTATAAPATRSATIASLRRSAGTTAGALEV